MVQVRARPGSAPGDHRVVEGRERRSGSRRRRPAGPRGRSRAGRRDAPRQPRTAPARRPDRCYSPVTVAGGLRWRSCVGRRPPRNDFFPGFTDIAEIGVGSLATVYRARELGTDRYVALKLLNVRDASPRALESFERESIALGAVSSHPNIVTLYRNVPRRRRAAGARARALPRLDRRPEGAGRAWPGTGRRRRARHQDRGCARDRAPRRDPAPRRQAAEHPDHRVRRAGAGRLRGRDAAVLDADHGRAVRLHHPARRARAARGRRDVGRHRRLRARLVAVPADRRAVGLPRLRGGVAGVGDPAHPARPRAAAWSAASGPDRSCRTCCSSRCRRTRSSARRRQPSSPRSSPAIEVEQGWPRTQFLVRDAGIARTRVLRPPVTRRLPDPSRRVAPAPRPVPPAGAPFSRGSRCGSRTTPAPTSPPPRDAPDDRAARGTQMVASTRCSARAYRRSRRRAGPTLAVRCLPEDDAAAPAPTAEPPPSLAGRPRGRSLRRRRGRGAEPPAPDPSGDPLVPSPTPSRYAGRGRT